MAAAEPCLRDVPDVVTLGHGQATFFGSAQAFENLFLSPRRFQLRISHLDASLNVRPWVLT
jgi:hypothetical protein